MFGATNNPKTKEEEIDSHIEQLKKEIEIPVIEGKVFSNKILEELRKNHSKIN